MLANGGHGASDDDNVVDLCRFVEAVQAYTGSTQVDIVGHSLGVTLARKFMRTYPQLAKAVVAFVGIAGANHGTTVCRGLDTSYYGCNEIAPGTAWLGAAQIETAQPSGIYGGLCGVPALTGLVGRLSTSLTVALDAASPRRHDQAPKWEPFQ